MVLERRWFVVAAAFATLLVASGAQSAYGVLLPLLEAEFGASRAASSLVMLLYLVAVGLWNVLAGWLTDRYGSKRQIYLGYIALVSGVAAWGFAASMLHLYLIHGLVISFGTVFLGLTVLSPLISQKFALRSGLALGIISTGFSLGQLITPTALAALTSTLDWRWALWFSSLGIGVVGLLTVAAIGEEHFTGVAPNSSNFEVRMWNSRGNHLKKAVYISATPYFICGFTDFLIMTHLVVYSTSLNLTLTSAALALSLIGAFNIPALILFGVMADKFGALLSLTLTYAVRLLSFIILLGADSALVIYLFAAIFGLTSYTTAPLAAKLVMCSYGSKRGSTVYGLLVLLHMVGGAVGALFGGLIYDAYLSYHPAFLTSTILVAAAVLLSIYAQNLAKRY
ncbi:MAG: MFS transporter [Nitrososphaerales archaeon]